jgi:hypothetical protein
MTYELSGNPDGSWMGSGCRTNLKTGLKITSPLGKKLKYNIIKNQIPIWESIPAESTIEWECLTQSDGTGANDRLNLTLQVFDMVYVAQITDSILETMSDEEIQLAIDDVDAFTAILTPKLEAELSPNQVFKNIWSNTVETDASGKTTGSLNIQPQWPRGQYNLLIHYGYDAESEASDNAKAVEFWVKEMLPMVVEVVFAIVATIATGGLAAGAFIIATAAAAYDLANMASQYQQTRFGASKINKYDCIFPMMGFNHSYSFTVEPEAEAQDIQASLSPENMDIVAAVNSYIELKGLGYFVAFGSLAFFGFLFVVNRLKGK